MKILNHIKKLSIAIGLFFPLPLPADNTYQPSPENLKARQEFSNHKFGIFLHWGIYSTFAQGEWYMTNAGINHNEYAKVASSFYPSKFDAKAWVKAFKEAGAKYICFTTRHHDGFSMFHTQYSPYNIVDATPFKRDVLQELVDECRKQGIKVHFYYSHIDWTRDDYPAGRTGRNTGKDPNKANWKSYYQFMNHQLTELITHYHPDGIWFDGMWDHDADHTPFDWQLDEQYALIHRLSPACLIGNNHHQTPNPGEDIQIFERDLPGENKAGLSGQSVSQQLPLETCQTMNGMWGYKIVDQNYKSARTLIQYLVGAAGKGANLLLNIGPQPNGELPAAALERLQEMGAWLQKYGETIYGTTAGDVPTKPWGVTTKKGDKQYIHILSLNDQALFVPIKRKIKKAVYFDDQQKVDFRQTPEGVFFTLDTIPQSTDYIIELTMK